MYGEKEKQVKENAKFSDQLGTTEVNNIVKEIYNKFGINVGVSNSRFECFIPGDVFHRMNTDSALKNKVYAMLADYSEAIENFIPRNYYNLEADYGQFRATLTQDKKNRQKFDTPEDVPVDIPKNGIVESKTVKRESTHAPQLYDLAAITTM